MGCTVSCLKRVLTLGEFYDWMRFYRESPFGDERVDFYFARFMAMFANAHRGEKKAEYTLTDFLMFGQEPRRELKEGEVWVSNEMKQFIKS
ncbi:MAG: DUF4035 domain-containing protein [Burkholderiales bacterium]|jgi:hypothetical protein|nr:DUF4035 domain-containing protein [Burkholderiales bacterium]